MINDQIQGKVTVSDSLLLCCEVLEKQFVAFSFGTVCSLQLCRKVDESDQAEEDSRPLPRSYFGVRLDLNWLCLTLG